MIGGPDDGASLYPEDRVPCLVCGTTIGVDYDGYVTWHFAGQVNNLGDNDWCPGSRTAWQVPA
jgi:hypothetical protein